MMIRDIVDKLKTGVREKLPVMLSTEECEFLRVFIRDAGNAKSQLGQKQANYLKAINLSSEANRQLRQKVAELESQVTEQQARSNWKPYPATWPVEAGFYQTDQGVLYWDAGPGCEKSCNGAWTTPVEWGGWDADQHNDVTRWHEPADEPCED